MDVNDLTHDQIKLLLQLDRPAAMELWATGEDNRYYFYQHMLSKLIEFQPLTLQHLQFIFCKQFRQTAIQKPDTSKPYV